eukprot:s23_g63.t1
MKFGEESPGARLVHLDLHRTVAFVQHLLHQRCGIQGLHLLDSSPRDRALSGSEELNLEELIQILTKRYQQTSFDCLSSVGPSNAFTMRILHRCPIELPRVAKEVRCKTGALCWRKICHTHILSELQLESSSLTMAQKEFDTVQCVRRVSGWQPACLFLKGCLAIP